MATLDILMAGRQAGRQVTSCPVLLSKIGKILKIT